MDPQKKPAFEIDQVKYDKLKINLQFFKDNYQRVNTYKVGVYEYKDNTGKKVVVKVFTWQQDPNNNGLSEKYLKNFDQEYKMLIRLNQHYNNQFPHCIGWTEDLTQQIKYRYVIMEKADISLTEFLRNKLTEEQRHLLMKQVWEIFKILQTLGISHRDVKTDQFLVFYPLVIKLTDFGSFSRRSKYIGSQSTDIQSLLFLTTPPCLSPELKMIVELVDQTNKLSPSSILQKVMHNLKITINENDSKNLNRIIQLIWHQFDSFAVGMVLLQIFGKGVSETCEDNVQNLKELLKKSRTDKEKQWILRMILLLQKRPQHRLTIQQIDRIESQSEYNFLDDVKGTWKDIYIYLSEQHIHMSQYFPFKELQLQELIDQIRDLKECSKLISQKSRTDEQNPIINIGSQERPIVEEQKQQQPLQQQQPQQVITEVHNYYTHFQHGPPIQDDPVIFLIAQVIYNAGRGEGKDGLEMVASTLLNRYKLNRRYLGGQNFEKIIDNNNGYKQQMAQEVLDSNKKTDQYQYSLTLARQLVNKEFQDTTGVGATHFSYKRDGFKSIEKKGVFTYQKQLGALYLFREH